ncbi:unnamed protein product [Heterobilharzia americana]|nr:unnamed protein product [Heterobilharzia americana]
MAPVRKSISQLAPDRFSKKHIHNEDGSMLVVSKKVKNMLKQDLKAKTTDMLVDDSTFETNHKESKPLFKQTLDETRSVTQFNKCLAKTSARSLTDDAIHRVVKKIPKRKRHKLRLQSYLSRNTNLQSALQSMEQNLRTDKLLDVQFPTDQSIFKKLGDQKAKSDRSQKVKDSRTKNKKPLSINVLDSFRSLLQQFR